MNQDKLDGLYALATDERTPDEERRNAAVLYLKHSPKHRVPTKEELLQVFTKDIARNVLSAEIALIERMAADAKTTAEKATKRAEKAESDLRELKEAVRAARAADEKVAKLAGVEPVKSATYRGNFGTMFDLFDSSDVFKKTPR